MTLLLTPCPHCGENFMMLDTEEEIGNCILCNKRSRFTRDEIDAAESRRDGLTEEYLEPIQKAFNDNDFDTVTRLCEEVGQQGVSSWYIWTVAGICDARQGKGDLAMESFGLATVFLDEESFDEFYDMIMDAILDVFVDDCNQERDFSISIENLTNLASTIEERFYEIMDIGFSQDLFIRIGMLVDEILNPKAFARLLELVIYYMFGFITENVYIPDHLESYESLSSSVESVANYAKEMEGQAWKDIAARAGAMMECISMLHRKESEILAEAGDDGVERISEYWYDGDNNELVTAAGHTMICCMAYCASGGRDKGMGKKTNAAVERYCDVLAEGMNMELSEYDAYDDEEWNTDEPEDEFQRMTDIDLPEDLEVLREVGRKALSENDIPLINDVAGAIVAMDDLDWFGWALAGVADASRNEITSAVWDFENSFYSVRSDDEKNLRDIIADTLSKAVSGSQDMKTALEVHSIMGIANLIDGKVIDGDGISFRILEELLNDAPLDSSDNRFVAYVVSNGVLSAAIHTYPQLQIQAGCASTTLGILKRIKGSMDLSDEDDVELLPSVEGMIDCTAHFVKTLETAIAKNGEAKLMETASRWEGNRAYHDIVDDMRNGFKHPKRFTPNSREAVANRRLVDEYVKKFLTGPQ